MKKNILFVLLILTAMVPVFAQYVPEIPVFTPTRYTAIGGYHVTDTTDYFTMFANPAGIHATEAEALSSTFDVRAANPELLLEIGKLAYEGIAGGDLDGATEDFTNSAIELIGENGINAGFELMGPLAVGSISNFDYGAFGWGLISKMGFFLAVPTFTQMDAMVDWDNMLQFSYAAPIINGDFNYLSIGVTAKGFFMAEAVLMDAEPLELISGGDIFNLLPVMGHYGFSFDIGVYYQFLNTFSAGLVWRDFFNQIWTKTFSIDTIVDDISGFDLPSSTNGSNSSSLDIGIGVDVPVFFLEAIITNLDVRLDYTDLISVLNTEKLTRNPILNLSFGTEITLIDFFSIRAGISDMYFNAGVGFRLGKTNIDFSMYGKELGLEPGSLPQFNASLAISKYY